MKLSEVKHTMKTELAEIQNEVTRELANKGTLGLLLATTFKGLNEQSVRKAIVEGMIRGFEFKDFLEKNIYAIPYGTNYSLVTSIDHARKIGMRSGVIGKSEPEFEVVNPDGKGERVVSCKVTIKRRVGSDIGEFSERVYFNEYTTGKNLWVSKPRTMIAKVAEMHALRMACPEELSQAYVEEEVQEVKEKPTADIEACRAKLEMAANLEELKSTWASLPIEAKTALEKVKENLKKKYENISLPAERTGGVAIHAAGQDNGVAAKGGLL